MLLPPPVVFQSPLTHLHRQLLRWDAAALNPTITSGSPRLWDEQSMSEKALEMQVEVPTRELLQVPYGGRLVAAKDTSLGVVFCGGNFDLAYLGRAFPSCP